MKNFNRKLLALLVVCSCLYGGFRLYGWLRVRDSQPPVLQIPADTAVLSVTADRSDLLRGVTARDEEDGDLTDRVFVESLSPMDENGERTVTYGVFDSDDQVSRASRQLRYSDYEPPRISISRPLVYTTENTEYEILKDVTADSVLDGDLSGQVVAAEVQEQENTILFTFQVTDSAGQSSRLSLTASFLSRLPSYQIQLSECLLRVAPGTEIVPEDYIEEISMMNMDYSDLADEVEIRTDYDPQTPGTYEFIYQLQRPSGDFGMTKLVVIVE